MTDRPLLFSAPMVRALLDGRKTQTRRPLKTIKGLTIGDVLRDGEKSSCVTLCARHQVQEPRFAVADRIWVRESVCWVSAHGWKYRADEDDLSDFREQGEVSKWYPSIHMPKHASRLTLTVTDMRVERLQDITESDARAEGVGIDEIAHLDFGDMPGVRSVATGNLCSSHKDAMREIWNSINGPGAWDANPWVCALTFTVHRQNIDAMAKP